MQRTDALIAATGTVVLVLAIAGSFFYASEDTVAAYTVTYPMDEVEMARAVASLPAAVGPSAGGSTRVDVAVPVSTPNLTELRFDLVVERAPTFAGEARFRYAIASPEGDVVAEGEFPALASQASVRATATTPLGDAPRPRDVEAGSPEGALARAREDASFRGLGNWTVSVEGEWTGAATNNFGLEVRVTGLAYRAEVGTLHPMRPR